MFLAVHFIRAALDRSLFGKVLLQHRLHVCQLVGAARTGQDAGIQQPLVHRILVIQTQTTGKVLVLTVQLGALRRTRAVFVPLVRQKAVFRAVLVQVEPFGLGTREESKNLDKRNGIRHKRTFNCGIKSATSFSSNVQLGQQNSGYPFQ